MVPRPSSRWRKGPCPVQNPQGLSVASSCLPGFPPKQLFWVHTLGQRQRWLRLSAIWVLSSVLLVWAWPDLVWIFSLFLGQIPPPPFISASFLIILVSFPSVFFPS